MNIKIYDKILLCDLDGTLTKPKGGRRFPKDWSDQMLLPGVYDTLSEYRKEGYGIAIVSNQGGIEAGYKTVDDTRKQMSYILSLLPQVDCAYFSAEDNYKNKPFWSRILHDIFDIRRNDCYRVTRYNFTKLNIRDYLYSWEFFYNGESLHFRKPAAGMLFAAKSDFGVDPLTLVDFKMTGDRIEDTLAAKFIGAAFIHAENFNDSTPISGSLFRNKAI